MYFFLNLVIPARSKVLICTRKQNPEDSGRSSKMVSSCQWPFSSFLLASSLLKSSVYFNHSGTLQSSAVVSYDIINIDKKLKLFSLQQKIEFGLGKKNSLLSGDKILCFFYFDSYPFVGSSYFAINVIGYTNQSRVSFPNRVSVIASREKWGGGGG